MKILFVSKSGSCLGLAERVQKEGHIAIFHIIEEQAKDVGKGMVTKSNFALPLLKGEYPIKHNVDQLLKRTSPDMAVFDMVKSGRLADYIRSSGTPVLGACRWADDAELDRAYGYKLMKSCGISVPDTKMFNQGGYEEAIRFVEKNRNKRYVYKPSGNIETSHTYVGKGVDDMAAMLQLWKSDKCEFELQEYVEGVEVSCELWWNGLNALVHNITYEEKKFMDGGVGPTTGCAGNVVKMVKPDSNIVKRSIGRVVQLLKKTNYRGPIDLNSIITPNKLYGLEFTVRFGYDALQALIELHKGSITQFLYNVVNGNRDVGEFTRDYAIAVRLSIPPYPHTDNPEEVIKGVPVLGVTDANAKHIWWGDIMKNEYYESAGVAGDVATAVARGRSAEECRRRVYRTIDNLIIPEGQWRTDIGTRVEEDEKLLRMWGYL